MEIRKFKTTDAEAVFVMRAEAIMVAFRDYVSDATAFSMLKAFLPSTYIKEARERDLFVVESGKELVGFFSIEMKTKTKAYIKFFYIKLSETKKGLGRTIITFIEKWLKLHHPEAVAIQVDTAVPNYNGGFYKKMGFLPASELFYNYVGRKGRLMRLEKPLYN